MDNKKMKIGFLIAVMASIAVSSVNILVPSVTQRMIDAAIQPEKSGIYKNVIDFFLVIILVVSAEYLRKVALARYIGRQTEYLRKEYLERYYRKNNSSIVKMSSQDYISMFNNDIDTVAKEYYGLAINITMSIFSIIIYSVALFKINIYIAIVAIIANLIGVAIPFILKNSVYSARDSYLNTMKKYNNKLSDAIIGHLTVRLFNVKNSIINLTDIASRTNQDEYIKFARRKSLVDVTVGLFSFLSLFSILSIGVHYVSMNLITIGALFAAIQISDLLVMPIINVSSDISSFLSAKKVNEKLKQIFQSDSHIHEEEAEIYENFESIALDNIKLYKNKKAVFKLKNINISRGMKYLVLGENGSGKSTLLNIIAGIEQSFTGDIIINGDKYTKNNLEINCAYATQKPFLFNDTLINNITLHQEYNVDKLQEIIKLLDIKELIKKKGNLIYTENDEKISGGEKQKIALARILLFEKDFLLLDEATSAMDNQSSIAIEEYLLSNPHITLVYVAHKTHKETISRFDDVIEMGVC